MIFLDSWVWIEYFSDGDEWQESDAVFQEMEKNGGVISTFVIMEVRYVLTRLANVEKAKKVTNIIKSFSNLAILPVTRKVAQRAADLKTKYRQRSDLSYGDAVMLATAVMSDCNVFYTGDGDFVSVEEMETEVIKK